MNPPKVHLLRYAHLRHGGVALATPHSSGFASLAVEAFCEFIKGIA
jgi:hypothetical protein